MAVVGDLALVSLKYSGPAGELVNTFGFEAINVAGTLANLASAFQTAVVKASSGGILNGAANTISSSELHVADVVPGTSAGYDYTYGPIAGGDASSEELPPQVTAVVTWRTALAGRSYRGRTFLPTTAEQNQDSGVLGATYTGYVNAFITQMLAVFGPTGSDTNWQFVVISRFNNGSPRATPIGTPVTSGLLRPRLYTQRRRVFGHGR